MGKHFKKPLPELEETPVAESLDELQDTLAAEPSEETPDVQSRMRALDDAEDAINAAFQTGKADRAAITREAQKDASEAVRLVGEAMEADEEADEADRLAVIAQNMGDREKTANARKRAREARRAAKQSHKAATKAAKEAYDAVKFSQPGKLGFLRFVQVTYGINIVSTLFALVLTSRDTIVYDSFTVVNWVTIILQGVAFWFFINYFKAAKRAVIFTSAFSIAALIVTSLINGTFSWFDTIYNSAWNIFLIVYFLLSKRVDAVLVNDFSTYRPREQSELTIKRSGWPFIRNLIMYFIVFSVLGHWMEAAMCQLIRLGLVQGEYDPSNTMLWRDWLYPYPMEGAAVVIIALALYPLWQHLLKRFTNKPIVAYIISFFANALTCSIIEFSMGMLINSNYQLWDYREMFGNIMGQVCLQNAMAFGVAASIIAWFVYPALERLLARVPNDTLNIVFVVIAVIGGILWSLYIIDPPENHKDEVAAPTAEQLAQEDRDAYVLPLASSEANIDDLREQLNDSKNLPENERAAIQEKIDRMESELKALETILQFEEAA